MSDLLQVVDSGDQFITLQYKDKRYQFKSQSQSGILLGQYQILNYPTNLQVRNFRDNELLFQHEYIQSNEYTQPQLFEFMSSVPLQIQQFKRDAPITMIHQGIQSLHNAFNQNQYKEIQSNDIYEKGWSQLSNKPFGPPGTAGYFTNVVNPRTQEWKNIGIPGVPQNEDQYKMTLQPEYLNLQAQNTWYTDNNYQPISHDAVISRLKKIKTRNQYYTPKME